MSIAELGSLGEFIGSIVVLATLIFLSFQVRQNTNAVKSAMAADLTAHFIENSLVLSNNSEMADLMARSTSGDVNSLSAKDKTRLFHWAMASLKSGDFAHYQWRKGNLDDDLWVGTAQTLIVSFQIPNHPWTKNWSIIREFCSPQFQSYIESIRDQAPQQESL